MRVFEQSTGRWVVVLAACAAAGGALELSFYEEPRFLITPLAVAVAALLMAFRSHQRSVEAQRINEELRALYEVAAALGSSLGVADSMNVLSSKLKTVIPFSTCALFLREGAEGASRCRFAAGTGQAALAGVTVRAGEGLVGLAIDRRECLARDLDHSPAAAVSADAPARELRSALVCPLGGGPEVLGAFALYHTAPGHFSGEHCRLAVRVSAQIAAVIDNSLTFERTQAESITDALTGLPNTRYLFPHLDRELARARRLGTSTAVLMLDLDQLKHLNDTCGHPTGDRALGAVAAGLRGAIRPYDICARYGGDEFIIVLSDCGADEAETKRIELQRTVAALPFTDDRGISVPLSVSIGAAVSPGDGETRDTLLREADGRMYLDKAARKRSAV